MLSNRCILTLLSGSVREAVIQQNRRKVFGPVIPRLLTFHHAANEARSPGVGPSRGAVRLRHVFPWNSEFSSLSACLSSATLGPQLRLWHSDTDSHASARKPLNGFAFIAPHSHACATTTPASLRNVALTRIKSKAVNAGEGKAAIV